MCCIPLLYVCSIPPSVQKLFSTYALGQQAWLTASGQLRHGAQFDCTHAACLQVEFLEKELGLPPFEAEAQARSSDSDSRNAAAREAATAAQQAESGVQQAARRAEENAARAKRDAEARAKAASDDVEDMLAELKRKRAQQQ